MNFSLSSIDLSSVNTEERPSILGAGKYTAQITSAKYDQNSKGTGWNLILEYKDTDSSGTIRSWTTVQHSNPDAQRIGLEQLKNLLVNMGWENSNPPEAAWYNGKTVGINVVDEKDHEGTVRSRVNYTFAAEPSTSAANVETLNDPIPF